MRCSRSQYLYEEYIAGTLAPATAARVDEHLAACAACRDFYETNDDIAELITDGNEVAHPGDGYLTDLKSRVMGSLASGRGGADEAPPDFDAGGRGDRRTGWPGYAGWSAAAAAILVVAFAFPPVLETLRPAPKADPAPTAGTTGGESASAAEAAGIAEVAGDGTSVGIAAADSTASAHEHRPDVVRDEFPLRRIVAERTGLRPQTVSVSPGTGLSATGSRSAAARVGASPAQGGGRSISKGVRGPDRTNVATAGGSADAGRMTPSEFIVSLFRSGRSIPSGRNAAGEPEYVTVRIPPQVLRQIIMHDVKGTPESRAEMYSLVQEIGRAVAELQVPQDEVDDPTFYQQYRDFHRADKFLSEGRAAEAAQAYEAIIAEDPDSTVGGQALYRLAGIQFDALGDFKLARELYGRFEDKDLNATLNDGQREELRRRIEVLDRHEPNRWGPLRCRSKVSQGSWTEASEALWSLSRLDDPDMLQDAGRMFVERLGRDPGPDRATASRLIASMKRLVDQTEDTRCRAWFSLALGDLVMRYESAQFGLQHFHSVVILDEQSVAAGIARDRLHQIRALPVSGR